MPALTRPPAHSGPYGFKSELRLETRDAERPLGVGWPSPQCDSRYFRVLYAATVAERIEKNDAGKLRSVTGRAFHLRLMLFFLAIRQETQILFEKGHSIVRSRLDSTGGIGPCCGIAREVASELSALTLPCSSVSLDRRNSSRSSRVSSLDLAISNWSSAINALN